MSNKTRKIGKHTVTVVAPKEQSAYISENDKNMDRRTTGAVKLAVEKAKICNKPIAKYDLLTKKAYVEYSDGKKKYVK